MNIHPLEEAKQIKKEFRGRTMGYISGALGLVAGLAWNDAVTNMINVLFPLSKETILVKFLYAAIITIVVVILVKYLEKVINREEK